MNTPPPYTKGNDFISIVFKGKPYTIYSNDLRFNRVADVITNRAWDKLEIALDTDKAFALYSHGHIKIYNGSITYKDKVVKNAAANRIIEFMINGFPFEPLVKFLDKLMENPSERSREQLYNYLEKYKLPICDDGDFIAQKSVREDYKDHHTGKIKNLPGKIIKLPRNRVSDDPNHACHFGLHVGSEEFVSRFGGEDSKIILVKINPKNVVSVPFDASSQKMRVCEYRVLDVVGNSKNAQKFTSNYAKQNTQFFDKNLKVIKRDSTGRFIKKAKKFIGADKAYDYVKAGKTVRTGNLTVNIMKPRAYFRKFKTWELI